MNKYRNVPTDGFASKKEAARYQELLLLQRAGEIRDLRTQVRFKFDKLRYEPSGRTPFYVADFAYIEGSDSKFIVEDVKSSITANNPAYKLKKALMRYFHGIEIRET